MAGVVVVVAVGLGALALQTHWEDIAYTRTEMQGIYELRKRWGFLPGPDVFFPAQACFICANAHGLWDHERCLDGAMARFGSKEAEEYHRGSSSDHPGFSKFTCTCPDPSHKDKP